jgi:hypothetical protein
MRGIYDKDQVYKLCQAIFEHERMRSGYSASMAPCPAFPSGLISMILSKGKKRKIWLWRVGVAQHDHRSDAERRIKLAYSQLRGFLDLTTSVEDVTPSGGFRRVRPGHQTAFTKSWQMIKRQPIIVCCLLFDRYLLHHLLLPCNIFTLFPNPLNNVVERDKEHTSGFNGGFEGLDIYAKRTVITSSNLVTTPNGEGK